MVVLELQLEGVGGLTRKSGSNIGYRGECETGRGLADYERINSSSMNAAPLHHGNLWPVTSGWQQ